MSALMLEILASVGVIAAGVAQVAIEQIRARTTCRALDKALIDAKPEDRAAIVRALAELVRGQPVARRDHLPK